MIYAIIFLFLYCVYLHLSKDALPYGIYDTISKVDELYKEHQKPLVEEYRNLKGYEKMELFSDSVNFPALQIYAVEKPTGIEYKDYRVIESVKYKELPQKLEQLKKDMKRGCELYCEK